MSFRYAHINAIHKSCKKAMSMRYTIESRKQLVSRVEWDSVGREGKRMNLSGEVRVLIIFTHADFENGVVVVGSTDFTSLVENNSIDVGWDIGVRDESVWNGIIFALNLGGNHGTWDETFDTRVFDCF